MLFVITVIFQLLRRVFLILYSLVRVELLVLKIIDVLIRRLVIIFLLQGILRRVCILICLLQGILSSGLNLHFVPLPHFFNPLELLLNWSFWIDRLLVPNQRIRNFLNEVELLLEIILALSS